jgi:Na+/proline symporter
MFGGSVVEVAFQSVFYLEMHQNNIFFIFLKLFLILVYQNDFKTQKIYQFEKKIKKI